MDECPPYAIVEPAPEPAQEPAPQEKYHHILHQLHKQWSYVDREICRKYEKLEVLAAEKKERHLTRIQQEYTQTMREIEARKQKEILQLKKIRTDAIRTVIEPSSSPPAHDLFTRILKYFIK